MRDASGEAGRSAGTASRRWLFADAVLDERSLTLTVKGQIQALDPKPMEVLLHLLNHAGELVTKDELLAAVWPGRILSDAGLTSCVARLRAALADDVQSIIKTVHGYGYRLVAPVKVEASTAPPPARFDFKAGDRPAGYPNWTLVDRLGTGGHGEVWLARQDKTGEPRIFKYALDEQALPSLKREITLSRYLHDTLGDDAPFVRVLDWNLDTPPFCIQAEYTHGGNLVKWAEAQGGIAKVPLAARLDLAVKIAEALAAAHSIGVLHKDLKPSNVLIDTKGEGPPRIRLADFGSGGVLQPGKLDALGITRMGLTMTQGVSPTSGTPIYLAPELIAEQPATMQTDIYAMGVLLYQLVVGDLKRPLALGWEHDVEDLLLREDIAAAAAGKAERRLTEAAVLVQRLRTLEARRMERVAQTPAAAAAAKPSRRRWWLPAIAAVAAIGVAGAAALLSMRPPAAVPVTVAVLPFVANGSSVEKDYLSTGISEELTAALSLMPGLHVRSGSTALAQQGKAAVEIARVLGAGALLTGAFTRTGDRLQLSAQLVNVADGEKIWSDSYDRPSRELFAILDGILKAVAARLTGRNSGPAPLVAKATDNLAAYEHYMRAVALSANNFNATDNAAAIALLEQAVTLDPGFARAWAFLASAHDLRLRFFVPSDLEGMRKGFAAAERALSLDPELTQARLARAMLLFLPANGFAAEQAIKEARRVLGVEAPGPDGQLKLPAMPSTRVVDALGIFSTVYWHWGLIDENAALQQRLAQNDPQNPARQNGLAYAALFQGKWEDALYLLEQQPRSAAPGFWHWQTTWALLELGRKPEAAARLDEFFRTQQDVGGIVTSTRAILHALEGKSAEVDRAAAELAKIDRRFGHFHHAAYNLGLAYAVLNRRKEAIQWLDWSARNGFPNYELFQRDPLLNNLRSDPGFKTLLEYTRQQEQKIRALGIPALEPAGPA